MRGLMGIDHRRAHIAMAEQFLHRSDAIATLQQMACEAVAQGVRGCRLYQTAIARRLLDCPLRRSKGS